LLETTPSCLPRNLRGTGSPFKAIPTRVPAKTQDPPRCARRVLPGLRPDRLRTALAGFARSATAAPARLRRAYAIPLPPRFARAVLLPRCARARPAPSAAWLAMSTAPRRVASARLARSLRSVTSLAWPRTTFRCVAGAPTLSASSPLRGSPMPARPWFTMPTFLPRFPKP
jgi:hypothetical protein